MYWGLYPHAKPDGVHFPNLKSLTLGNFSFHKDKQLDWITSHSTLQELYLDNCPILFHIAMHDSDGMFPRSPIAKSDMYHNESVHWKLQYTYPRRWYGFFVAIEIGLPHLYHFGFGINQEWDMDVLPFESAMKIVPALKEDRYMGFDCGIRDLGPEALRPTCHKKDREALKALDRKIGQQIDRGTVTIGGYTVENLIKTGQNMGISRPLVITPRRMQCISEWACAMLSILPGRFYLDTSLFSFTKASRPFVSLSTASYLESRPLSTHFYYSPIPRSSAHECVEYSKPPSQCVHGYTREVWPFTVYRCSFGISAQLRDHVHHEQKY